MSSTLGSPEVQLKNHVSHHVHIAPRNGWAFYCTSCLMREALPWWRCWTKLLPFLAILRLELDVRKLTVNEV